MVSRRFALNLREAQVLTVSTNASQVWGGAEQLSAAAVQ